MKKHSLLFVLMVFAALHTYATVYNIQDAKGYENIVIENQSNLNTLILVEGFSKKTVNSKSATIATKDLLEKGSDLQGQLYKLTVDYADPAYELNLQTSEENKNLVITITATKLPDINDIDWDF